MTKRKTSLKTGGPLLSVEETAFDLASPSEIRADITKDHLRRVAGRAHEIAVTKIWYRSNGHGVIGYVVEPRNARGKLPCIIVNRGGNREFGTWTMFNVFNKLGYLALQGYVVIATQYSGAGGSEGKDEFGGSDLNDVLVLRRVLALHARADISRIGMYGTSRGGLMVYLALAKVEWIKAAVVIAGPTNKIRGLKLRPEMKKEYRETFGGSIVELKKRSAVFWADRINKKTPLLILHGTADWRVSPLDSLDLSATLLKCGKHHRLMLFEGGDHGLTNFAKERNVAVRDWFARHLA